MADIIYPEWRDQISHVRYPFSDAATLDNGVGRIPDGFLVDLSLYPPGASGQVYLASIERVADQVIMHLSDDLDVLCYAEYPASGAGEITFYMEPSRGYRGVVGMAVCGEMDTAIVGGWPVGTYEYTRDQCPIVPDVVMPMPSECVRGFVLADGTLVTGAVTFYGEDGVSFRYNSTDNVIKVDAIGDPLHNSSWGGEAPGYTGLKTINGVRPNDSGHIRLNVGKRWVQDPALRISPSSSGHGIEIYFITPKAT